MDDLKKEKEADKNYDISSLSASRVVTKRFWYLISIIALCSFLLVIWMIVGTIPVKIQGNGIIISKSGLSSVQSTVGGTVAHLHVHAGDKVKKGEYLLEIYDPQMELRFEAANTRVRTVETQLNQLKNQIAKERAATNQALQAKIIALQFTVSQLQEEVNFLTQKLDAHKKLLDQGLISGEVYHKEEQTLTQSKIDLQEKISALNEALSESKKEYRPQELSNKEQQLLQETQARDQILVTLELGKIISSEEGVVLEVMVDEGDQVQAGKQLLWIEKEEGDAKDQTLIYAFFPVESGKRINLNSSIEMILPSVNYNEYGAIEGKVLSVSQFAVSKENIFNKIQNKSIVDSLVGLNSAVIEVIIEPKKNSEHPNQLAWTSGKIPPLNIPTGAVGIVEATVERVRPIYYVLPLPAFKYKSPNVSLPTGQP